MVAVALTASHPTELYKWAKDGLWVLTPSLFITSLKVEIY